MSAQSALRADSWHIKPFLRERLDVRFEACVPLWITCPSVASGIAPKPTPRERPVSRSMIIWVRSTRPYGSNSRARSSSVVVKARLPTPITPRLLLKSSGPRSGVGHSIGLSVGGKCSYAPEKRSARGLRLHVQCPHVADAVIEAPEHTPKWAWENYCTSLKVPEAGRATRV